MLFILDCQRRALGGEDRVMLQGSSPRAGAAGPPGRPSNLLATSDRRPADPPRLDRQLDQRDRLRSSSSASARTCTNFAEIARVDARVNIFQVSGLATGHDLHVPRARAQRGRLLRLHAAPPRGPPPPAGRSTVRDDRQPARRASASRSRAAAQLNGTRIFITPCTEAPNRQWTVFHRRAFAGDIRMFGTMCFDAFSGLGRARGPDRPLGVPRRAEPALDAHRCRRAQGQRQRPLRDAQRRRHGRLHRHGHPDLHRRRGAEVGLRPCNGDMPPVAAFTVSCTGTASATSTAARRATTRGSPRAPGTTATAPRPATWSRRYKIFAGGGTFHVTLTVTDVAGQSTALVARRGHRGGLEPGRRRRTSRLVHQPRPALHRWQHRQRRTIAGRSWAFGDGSTSTQTNPSRTYTAGRHVHRDAHRRPTTRARPAASRRSVTVSAPPPPPSGVPISSRASGKCLGGPGRQPFVGGTLLVLGPPARTAASSGSPCRRPAHRGRSRCTMRPPASMRPAGGDWTATGS